jgi:hypothetical protein
VTGTAARGWLTTSGALSIAGGIVVLAALVWQVGAAEIRDGLMNVRWVFPFIVALGGLRFAVRALAWSLCVEPPHRLGMRHAFSAVVAGDSLGNATPLGPVVSEPAKVAFARSHVAVGPSLTALAVENLFYTLATLAMIAAGTLALLFAFQLPERVRNYSEVAVLLLVAGLVCALLVLRRRPALVSRWLPLLSKPGSRLHSRGEKLAAMEHDIYSFAGRRRGAVLPVAGLELAFHALGVLETHITMWTILGDAPPLLTSFIIETASRLITVVFKFVPLQIGVAEGGLAVVTELLGFGTSAGVSFSLVRKARMGVWALVGAALLVRRGITPRAVLADSELRASIRRS